MCYSEQCKYQDRMGECTLNLNGQLPHDAKCVDEEFDSFYDTDLDSDYMGDGD